MSKMNCHLSQAEINHLRRLLAYIDLELGQEPEAMVETVKGVVAKIGPVSDEGVARLRESYGRSVAVPKYIRAAIKALKKTLATKAGEVLDVEPASHCSTDNLAIERQALRPPAWVTAGR